MRTPNLVPLYRQVFSLVAEMKEISGNYELILIGDHDPYKPMNVNTADNALWVMGYDTKGDVCGHVCPTKACNSLIKSSPD